MPKIVNFKERKNKRYQGLGGWEWGEERGVSVWDDEFKVVKLDNSDVPNTVNVLNATDLYT